MVESDEDVLRKAREKLIELKVLRDVLKKEQKPADAKDEDTLNLFRKYEEDRALFQTRDFIIDLFEQILQQLAALTLEVHYIQKGMDPELRTKQIQVLELEMETLTRLNNYLKKWG